jgi:selenium-binding protein 1
MNTNTRTTIRLALTAGVMLPAALAAVVTQHAAAHGRELQERFLYVSTIAQSDRDPDFIAVIGADPDYADFGEIVNRVDMPNVGDELHHFGYSADQQRLIVPGLFSSRIHVLEVGGDGSTVTVDAVNEDLVTDSGYTVPHGVMAMHGMVLAPMIGSANDQTQPGGIVQLDDRTGEFVDYFGPGPQRDAAQTGPTYMYDFAMTPDGEWGISTTFGPPALCAAGIDPGCLGDEVAVWDVAEQRVVQTESLGANSGALMVRFVPQPGVRRAFINAPGTSTIWLASDDDGDGEFGFQEVLGPDDGLELPVDMIVSYDASSLYVSNWFGDTVQQFDITDPFAPTLQATVAVPHPNMLRLSPDDGRLYVTNSLLTTWDNDPDFGPARNSDYGIWLFEVTAAGGLEPRHPDGSPWVSFAAVEKQTTTGPAGPHMMLFDPSIALEPGEH